LDNDDQQRGVILSRRDALKILGVTSVSLLAGCVPGFSGATQAPSATFPATSVGGASGLPACVVRPELTEGPYYVDEALDRSDIRSDPASGAVRPGVPLTLTFQVSQVTSGACSPLPGARVDVWHCDALGVYSDVSDPGFDTKGQKFLRGFQVTDPSGKAQFLTIYPGWYSGRTVHIHFKIYHDVSGAGRTFTSQLFFDDALSDKVFAEAPYSGRGARNTRNSNDGFFNSQMLLDAVAAGSGYAADFAIGVQLT
jgi:protocatechuate 3,4-dioxygenase beta subunit